MEKEKIFNSMDAMMTLFGKDSMSDEEKEKMLEESMKMAEENKRLEELFCIDNYKIKQDCVRMFGSFTDNQLTRYIFDSAMNTDRINRMKLAAICLIDLKQPVNDNTVLTMGFNGWESTLSLNMSGQK